MARAKTTSPKRTKRKAAVRPKATPENAGKKKGHCPGKAHQIVVCPEIVEYVAKKMALGFRHYELRNEINRDLNTKMSDDAFNSLQKEARKHIADILLTPEQHRCNAIEMLYQVVQNPSTGARDRLRACEILLNAVSSIPEKESQERSAYIRDLLKEIGDPFDENE